MLVKDTFWIVRSFESFSWLLYSIILCKINGNDIKI